MVLPKSAFEHKSVLVIDDIDGMCTQIRMALQDGGFSKIHIVPGAREALQKLTDNRYDIILCDYLLGETTNGQQFLEYLRIHDLIPRNTIFMMLTAEHSYDMVMIASECMPDDYLLKPFTPDQLNIRLNKLVERQNQLARIDQATDDKDWLNVINECDKLLELKNKYFFDLCRIKGTALLKSGQTQAAIAFYREILASRPIIWAKLGLARGLAGFGCYQEAETIALDILEEAPQFMAVYDFLSQLNVEMGNAGNALSLLQKARFVSPGTMNRVRKLSILAIQTEQAALAEEVMKKALIAHRYSPVRTAKDYSILAKSLIKQNKTEEALAVLQEARKYFSDKNSRLTLDVTECNAQYDGGSLTQAQSLLDKVLIEEKHLLTTSVDMLLDVSESCLKLNNDAFAEQFLRHVIQNNDNDPFVKKRVTQTVITAGRDPKVAEKIILDSEQEVIRINDEGVAKAQAGELLEAIELLSAAVHKLPNNVQILSNIAMVYALDLNRNGISELRLNKYLFYRSQLHRKAPNHPKLATLDKILDCTNIDKAW